MVFAVSTILIELVQRQGACLRIGNSLTGIIAPLFTAKTRRARRIPLAFLASSRW